MRLNLLGTGINYDVDGTRTHPPVIFIHGFPFSKEMWKTQVEFLKKEYYVITYDVRGHGSSDVGDGQYTLEYFVDDLIGLLDHLKINKTAAVGLSMGGYITLRAAERNPERFRALVLCDTRSEADNNEGKIKRAAQAKSVKTEGMKKFSEAFVKTVFYSKTFENNPASVSSIRQIIENTSPLAVAGTLTALAARTDATSSLYNIKIPVLLLVGQHDTLTPPSASNAMRQKIPNSLMHIIPDAAHLSNVENPSEFNSKLLQFLKSIGP